LIEQVKELARIRDEEGYIAESKKDSKSGGGKYILLDYNWPIIHIAEKHWEACSTERKLFEKLLGANIYRNNSQSCQRRLDL
jgi:predicted ArsR family transcriptional regulator